MNDDGAYVCDGCGEEIVIPLDPNEGRSQEYVEDCPVCCRPNVIHVEWNDDNRGSGPRLSRIVISRNPVIDANPRVRVSDDAENCRSGHDSA